MWRLSLQLSLAFITQALCNCDLSATDLVKSQYDHFVISFNDVIFCWNVSFIITVIPLNNVSYCKVGSADSSSTFARSTSLKSLSFTTTVFFTIIRIRFLFIHGTVWLLIIFIFFTWLFYFDLQPRSKDTTQNVSLIALLTTTLLWIYQGKPQYHCKSPMALHHGGQFMLESNCLRWLQPFIYIHAPDNWLFRILAV